MLPRVCLRAESRVFSCRLHARNYGAAATSLKRRKVWDSADEAIKDAKTGDVLLSGETLITALSKGKGVTKIAAVSNNAGSREGPVRTTTQMPEVDWMLKSGQLEKLAISYLGGNKHLERMYLDGSMSLELVPQGTLAERMRAHATGIPAFFTSTGASTTIEGNKKEFRVFDGKRYVTEPAIAGDVAFIHAWKADEAGNLAFRYVANNHSNIMARNAKLTIVEAEEIVPIGTLSPNAIHYPGIFIDESSDARGSKSWPLLLRRPRMIRRIPRLSRVLVAE
ncbi:A subunit of 3-oxoacid CoA-transferase [Lanmaoa asiatica]|nr:A subunit of 3-oxoacid CoA-transferase [Lanmaoa asiatica]